MTVLLVLVLPVVLVIEACKLIGDNVRFRKELIMISKNGSAHITCDHDASYDALDGRGLGHNLFLNASSIL